MSEQAKDPKQSFGDPVPDEPFITQRIILEEGEYPDGTPYYNAHFEEVYEGESGLLGLKDGLGHLEVAKDVLRSQWAEELANAEGDSDE